MEEWPDIVRRYSPLVRRTAYRLLGNHADAGDCVQEVFISVFRSSRSQEIDNWVGLLRRVTVCRAMDMLRERFRRNGRSFDLDDWAVVACTKAGPSQSAEDREWAARLRQSLAQLPAQQAEVFYLVCIEELSHEQTAAYLETTAGNVRVLLHRARAKLCELLASSETPADR